MRGGGALSGTVRISSSGNVVSGRLGGRSFRLTFANSSSVRDTSLPEVADVLRYWKLRNAG